MPELKKPHLPIGYWLKKADEVLTIHINEVQQAKGLSRIGWQILNVLHEVQLATREQLAEPLRPFADAATLEDTVLRLIQRELIVGDGSEAIPYRLTKLGQELHEAALGLQKEVRQRAVKGINEGDYAIAVRVLQTIVENLSQDDTVEAG